MREIVFELKNGNPYYKPEDKPENSQVLFPISDDKKAEENKAKPKPKQPTAEELEQTRQELLTLMNKK